MALKFPHSREQFLATSRAALADQLRRLERDDFHTHVRLPKKAEAGTDSLPPGLHLHPLPELSIQLSGVSKMTFSNQTVVSRPGDLLIIPAGSAHHELVGAPLDQFLNLVVRFHDDGVHVHLSAYRNNNPSPTIILAETFPNSVWRLEWFFSDAYKALQQKGAQARKIGQLLLQAGIWGLTGVLGSKPFDAPSEHPTVSRCRMFVLDRLSSPQLSVASLAKEFGYSSDHLSRLFHSWTGQTLVSYINEARIGHAKQLLSNPSISIKEIAAASGYRSPGYFIRVFRQTQGTTPLSFRKGLSNGILVNLKK
jgi:AraC-like DNA-binding protein